jgi:hypothetical protein
MMMTKSIGVMKIVHGSSPSKNAIRFAIPYTIPDCVVYSASYTEVYNTQIFNLAEFNGHRSVVFTADITQSENGHNVEVFAKLMNLTDWIDIPTSEIRAVVGQYEHQAVISADISDSLALASKSYCLRMKTSTGEAGHAIKPTILVRF